MVQHCPGLSGLWLLCVYTVVGALRIVGGPNTTTGRLEIFFNGLWGSVCDDGWSHAEADVACRQMGYAGGRAIDQRTGLYGEADEDVPIWLDEVACAGTEARLDQCSALEIGDSDCYHEEDAGVACFASLPQQPSQQAPRSQAGAGQQAWNLGGEVAVELVGSFFSFNEAGTLGGAVYMEQVPAAPGPDGGSTVLVEDCRFQANTAGQPSYTTW